MTTGTIEKRSRRASQKEARPAELIAAALTLFVERGFAATRIEDVAARAGVSKGTAYLYFPNKVELFRAAIRETVLPQIATSVTSLREFEGSAEDLLRALVSQWRDYQKTPSGGLLKIMVSEAGNFPELARFYLREVVLPGRDFLVEIVRRGVETGEFRNVDPAKIAPVVFAPLSLLSIWNHSLGKYEPSALEQEEFLAAFLDLAIAGLKAG